MPDIRKTLSDPKPLYFVAGAGDAAVERLRDAPSKLAEAQERIASDAPSWFSEAQHRLVEAQGKVRSDLDSFRESISGTDLRGLRERAQVMALSQVGRALEVAGKAVEAYDELAERGKSVVERLLGESAPVEENPATVIRVEQVSVEDEPKTASEPKAEEKPAAEAPSNSTGAKPRAKKTAPSKTTAPKVSATGSTAAKKTTAPRRGAPKKETEA
jgi:heparin binding hemagglutinin HbhA